MRWQTTPNGRGQGHVTHFLNIAPIIIIFGIGEARHFIFRLLTDTQKYYCMQDILLKTSRRIQSHVTFLDFGKIVNISLTVMQWNTNRKPYVAYRMALSSIPLNDLEGHFTVHDLSNFHTVRRSLRALTVDSVTWCCRRPGCVAGCPWGAVRRDLTVDVDRRSAVSGYGRLILL